VRVRVNPEDEQHRFNLVRSCANAHALCGNALLVIHCFFYEKKPPRACYRVPYCEFIIIREETGRNPPSSALHRPLVIRKKDIPRFKKPSTRTQAGKRAWTKYNW
jgi:hypothetical protein